MVSRGWELPDSQGKIDPEQVWQRRYRKAMALKDELGLNDDERHELAEFIPGTESGSWRELTAKQLHDLITMMEGFLLVSYLFSQRVDTPTD